MHDELKRALRRVDPPAGFADRVLQRAATKPPQAAKSGATTAPSRFRAPLRWAMAATLVAAAGGGLWYRAEERRKQDGEQAKQQVLYSLGLAGSKLRSVEMKVNHQEGR